MCTITEPTYYESDILWIGYLTMRDKSLSHKRFNTVAFSSVLMSQGVRNRIHIKVGNIYYNAHGISLRILKKIPMNSTNIETLRG
jgi:hypothetical protein